MPKVSVIVPVYGVEKYIEKCAISLFEQTLDDIEFIFIDDCTSDKSIDILNKVIEKYKTRIIDNNYKVRIERMLVNSGSATVRNWGIKCSTGDYIIHCDSDDWVDSTMYEKMYNHAIKYNSDLVLCDYIISNGNKNYDRIIKKNIKDCSKKVLIKSLLTSCALNNVWSTLAKRDLFSEILYPIGDMSEDKTYMIQLVWKAQNITYIPEALYFYYQSQNSIVRKKDKKSCIKKFKQSMDNRQIILNFFKKENINIPQDLIDSYILIGKLGFIESFLSDPECRKLWSETFPIPTWRVLINPCIRIKSKLRYLYAKLIIM